MIIVVNNLEVSKLTMFHIYAGQKSEEKQT